MLDLIVNVTPPLPPPIMTVADLYFPKNTEDCILRVKR